MDDTKPTSDTEALFDVIIIGAGPAGMAAAIYTGRSRLNTLVLDASGGGGQLNIVDHIENYPGFTQPQDGPALAQAMRTQMEGFGAKLLFDQAVRVETGDKQVTVHGSAASYRGRALIVACGVQHKELCLPSEQRFKGRGVSYCATCDGAFFRGQPVAMIGGGDTAVKEAIYLSSIVGHVTLVHRRDQLRAEKLLQERLQSCPNVDIRWDSVVEEILGKDSVRGVRLRNLKTGERGELPVQGVFVFIGIVTGTEFLEGVVRRDINGFIPTNARMRTSHPLIFAAGDIRVESVRQIGTAVGDGITAAITIQEMLDTLNPPRDLAPVCETP